MSAYPINLSSPAFCSIALACAAVGEAYGLPSGIAALVPWFCLAVQSPLSADRSLPQAVGDAGLSGYSRINPRRIATDTASARVAAPSFPSTDAT